MEHIAVSVIVPIYNAEPWLEECVQSILDQDFPASYGTIEVLLIDDGATDGSGALCDRLAKRDNRIKVVHQENQGLSGARNTGIDMARGRYYAFIDSDDVVRPAYLKKMYEACEAHDAKVSGPIPLPTKTEIVTILRAVHKYKDSREQFEMRTHKRLIDILRPSNKTVEALMSLELPAGVDIEIKL